MVNRNMLNLIKKVGFYFLIIFMVVFCIFPFYYSVITSFKTGTSLFRVDYFLTRLDFSNYIGLLNSKTFNFVNILNSIVVSSVTVILCLSCSVTASYALGRIRFKGRSSLLLVILSISMFPQVAVLSGMFQLLKFLNLYNSIWGLVLAYTLFSLPFTVWVLTTFMRGLPAELEEAAIMDGAAPLTIIIKIFLPIMIPALITTGLLAFIGAWNEFLFALTFTLDNENRTIPVAISMISGSTSEHEVPWGTIMAASVLVTLPLVLLVLVFQRKIVSGLTAGAIKG